MCKNNVFGLLKNLNHIIKKKKKVKSKFSCLYPRLLS